jgi:hypothetical protein
VSVEKCLGYTRYGIGVELTLHKTSIADHQWTVKQFWVDRQSFKQEDNIYCLVRVQINKLNVYLQFKLNYDVCYTYEPCLYIFPIIKLN